jgi:hypothetical protein
MAGGEWDSVRWVQGGRQRLCAEREHGTEVVELSHWWHCGFLARSGEGCGVCWVRRLERVCAKCEDRGEVVSFPTGQSGALLSRRGQWHGVC